MGFGNRYIASIIIKKEIEIPSNIVHFKSIDFEGNPYIDIPLNMLDIENIRDDFRNFESIFEVNENKEKLSKETNILLEILNKLQLKSFLLESFTDFNPNYWIDDLLIIVVVDGLIIKETIMNVIDEKGNLISDKYGYTDYPILYANFKEAKMIYQNKKNNE